MSEMKENLQDWYELEMLPHERRTGKKLVVLSSDNGTEYKNEVVISYLRSIGVRPHKSSLLSSSSPAIFSSILKIKKLIKPLRGLRANGPRPRPNHRVLWPINPSTDPPMSPRPSGPLSSTPQKRGRKRNRWERPFQKRWEILQNRLQSRWEPLRQRRGRQHRLQSRWEHQK